MHALSVTLIAFFAFFEVVKCGGIMHGDRWSRRHNDVARAHQNASLRKRFDNCRFTFFDAGLGACGKVNEGSDFVSISLYECLSWRLNDYVDRCSQCGCKTRLILFGC